MVLTVMKNKTETVFLLLWLIREQLSTVLMGTISVFGNVAIDFFVFFNVVGYRNQSEPKLFAWLKLLKISEKIFL